MILPRDTTPEAYRVQIAILAKLSSEARSRMACEASDCGRAAIEKAIRRAHPDADENEVLSLLIRQLHGQKVAELCERLRGGVSR